VWVSEWRVVWLVCVVVERAVIPPQPEVRDT
jgi:hypothetical protein